LAVAEALQNEDVLLIEAGTGVGKSLAYLVPAALWAKQTRTPVMIATHTLHLQDQLYNQDLPFLAQAYNAWEKKTKSKSKKNLLFALIKGREHYLCSKRFKFFLDKESFTESEVFFLVKLLIWLPNTLRGEKQELSLISHEHYLWRQVNAASEMCHAAACFVDDYGCFYARAWQQALEADIVVTNQSCLLANHELASDAFPYVIIDEAHHLEQVIVDQSTLVLDEFELKTWLASLGGKEKGRWKGLLRSVGLFDQSDLSESADLLHKHIQLAIRHAKIFFKHLKGILEQSADSTVKPLYQRDLRISYQIRNQDAWFAQEEIGANLKTCLSGILDALQLILDSQKQEKKPRLDPNTIKALIKEAKAYLFVLQKTIFDQDERKEVVYLRLDPRLTSMSICCAPLQVASQVQERLLACKQSLVLTSATLSVGGDFSYALERLGLHDIAVCHLVDSPFNYRKQVQLYIPPHLPQVRDRGYDQAIAQEISKLCQLYNGRCLVLFTSYQQLKRTHQLIYQKMEKEGIQVLSQGIIGNRNKIITAFKKNSQSVILGASSFWEGVDFPGDQLKCVVIVKLPFDVPSDPVISAMLDLYENPFSEFSLPRSILRFRQGFGRLIRTTHDQGLVAILDSRIVNKSYGRDFLISLPSGLGIVESI
ncbi:MAG TPA: hypothetical protein ENN77_01835, partial [Candidatus Wirthbacteria bacterium]|nr:hypothetical protein [Candidatus Wirthbacteria bacterium]